MQKNKIIQNVSLLIFYLLFAPPTLAAVKDSIHGAFSGVMAWDLFYNILGGAGGGVIQVVRNLQNIAVELALSMFISAFAGLLTYLFVAGTDIIAISGLTMLFLSCCAGVLGYEAIKLYTDDFQKNLKGGKSNVED